jgi:type I restriction enzyme S subunit
MNANWQTKTLGEVCEVIGGGTPSKAISKYWNGNIPWVSPKDMKTFEISDSIDHISSDAILKSATSLIPSKSILIVVRSGILARTIPLAITRGEVTLNQDMKALIPHKDVDSNYLLWALRSEESTLLNLVSKGATVHRIQSEHLLNLSLSIPPLPEQRRIVAILDDVFARAATAKANAEKNLANAREVFESYLQRVFAESRESNEERRFEEIVASNIVGLTKHSRDQGVNRKYPYVKMNNITRDNRLDLSKLTYVDATKEEIAKFSLRNGDFLFNTRNSKELVGKTCVFLVNDDTVHVLNNNIMRVRFVSGINSHYVNYAFSSPPIIRKLELLKSGTTNVWAIYYKDLSKLILPVPSSSAQDKIVANLNALSAETKKLEAIYTQKLAALQELKKSVLRQAFSGQL